MERLLKLADGQTVQDQQEIDGLLDQRRSLIEQRKTTPPSAILKDFNLSRVSLSRRERVLIGTLEVEYGGEKPFERPLFGIADITIDLTPEAEDLPRRIMSFELSDGNEKITFDVLFNEQASEYWKHYGNESEIERIASAHLLSLLEETNEANWQCHWTGAWSVVK